jgi:hypothetical protein
MTSKEAAVKPQEVPAPKTVAKTTHVLGILVAILATAVVVTIANWFLYESIHTDARAAVISDMQVVSKTVEQ